MNWKRFADMYAARWRPLAETDGTGEWAEAVGHMEEQHVKTAMGAIIEANRRRDPDRLKPDYGPRLPEIMEQYNAALSAATPYIPPEYICQTCGNSGWSMGLKTAKGYWINPGFPEHVGETLHHALVPCYCDLGRQATQTNEMPGGLPQSRRDAMRRYAIIPMGNTQDITDHRCISWLRELHGECEQGVAHANA